MQQVPASPSSELAPLGTGDGSFLLPQSLSGGEAQSTCSDLDPQGSGHREEAFEF